MSQVDQSILVLPVPAAEGLLAGLRDNYPIVGGMVPHITVYYPFLNREQLDQEVIAELRELLATLPAIELQFDHCQRFHDRVLYLAPTMTGPLLSLTIALAEKFPDLRPYEDEVRPMIPHLTVMKRGSRKQLDQLEAKLTKLLPLSSRADYVELYLFDGQSWILDRRFDFAGE